MTNNQKRSLENKVLTQGIHCLYTSYKPFHYPRLRITLLYYKVRLHTGLGQIDQESAQPKISLKDLAKA